MAEHFCQAVEDESGIDITCGLWGPSYDEDGNPYFCNDDIEPCGEPASHENPEYLLEDGFFNYAHWLCDDHFDFMVEEKLNDE